MTQHLGSTSRRDFVASVSQLSAIAALSPSLGAESRERADRALAEVPRLTVVSARDSGLTSPLLSYRLPDQIAARELYDRLREKHRVIVKVVPTNWFNGQRISTHLFNTEHDVDALAAALRSELA